MFRLQCSAKVIRGRRAVSRSTITAGKHRKAPRRSRRPKRCQGRQARPFRRLREVSRYTVIRETGAARAGSSSRAVGLRTLVSVLLLVPTLSLRLRRSIAEHSHKASTNQCFQALISLGRLRRQMYWIRTTSFLPLTIFRPRTGTLGPRPLASRISRSSRLQHHCPSSNLASTSDTSQPPRINRPHLPTPGPLHPPWRLSTYLPRASCSLQSPILTCPYLLTKCLLLRTGWNTIFLPARLRAARSHSTKTQPHRGRVSDVPC
jgi:hypothetical protein